MKHQLQETLTMNSACITILLCDIYLNTYLRNNQSYDYEPL